MTNGSRPCPLPVGYRISQSLRLDEAAIIAGAQFFNDTNPVHSDPAAAKAAGFDALIACGQHSCGLHACMLGSYPSSLGLQILGLTYNVRYRRPIFAGILYEMEWHVFETLRRGSNWEVHWSGAVRKASDGQVALETGASLVVLNPNQADTNSCPPQSGFK